MYDRILVPTDGSEQRPVVAQAMNVAELADATVHALYVVDERALDYQPSESGREETRDARREEGEEATHHIAEAGADRGVEVVTAIEEGKPAKAIVSYADEKDADMVVMGTHGRTGLDHYLIGSVTEKVVRLADVPVLTVPLPEETSD